MRLHHIVRAELVMTLILWAGGVAVAADGSEAQDTGTALDAANLDAVRADLQKQGLSEAEASDLLHEASRDVLTGAKEAPVIGREASDTRGIIVTGPGNLGRPELGGGQGQNLTPQEKALMDKAETLGRELAQKGFSPEQIHQEIETKMGDQFREAGRERGVISPGERDDTRLKELYEKGTPGIEHAPGLEKMREGFEHGRPDLGETRGGGFEHELPSRELYREMPETHEAPMREMPARELPVREIEQPTRESSREVPSREVEHPTTEERPTMERPPQEAPHY